MDGEVKRYESIRALRRTDKNSYSQRERDGREVSVDFRARGAQGLSKLIRKRSPFHLLLAGGIAWAIFVMIILLILVRACQLAEDPGSGPYRKNSWVFIILDTLGLPTKPPHRCPIPLLDDPDAITIPPCSKSVMGRTKIS